MEAPSPKLRQPGRLPAKHLPLFLLAGAVGFLVDGGLLALEVHVLGMNVYLARAVSFTVAVTVTWWLNRRLAFNETSSPRGGRRSEYARYLIVQVVGALVNLGVFSGLVAGSSSLKALPIIPLAVGAAFGLVVNYAGSRYWVFRARAEDSQT